MLGLAIMSIQLATDPSDHVVSVLNVCSLPVVISPST